MVNQEQETRTHARFTDFQLSQDVLEALDELGFVETTPIQEKVIGPILEGRDVVGKAETGTGKTIGFGAPLVGKIDTQRVAVQALILAPTRELAQQVAGVLEQLGRRRELGVVLLVGGVHASGQIETLRGGSQVVVGTPGRVLDMLRERILSLGWCETVVLDEADRMLDMGFIEDVGNILEKTPQERQTLLFSATMPPQIKVLLNRYMKDPEIHSTSSGLSTVPEISQVFRKVEFRNKFNELRKILDRNPDDTAIIFCNTRRQAIDLDRMLWGHGYSAGALHGDQEQDFRFRILEAFRQGDIRTLVATDVASRGLDIEGVARVINYEVPDEIEAYVHRIGRTGRANREGQAITLVASKERRSWQQILKSVDFEIVLESGGRRGAPAEARSGDRPDRDGSSRSRGRGRRGRRSRSAGGSRRVPNGEGGDSGKSRGPDADADAVEGTGSRAAGKPAGKKDAGETGPRRSRRRRRSGSAPAGGASTEGATPRSGGGRGGRPRDKDREDGDLGSDPLEKKQAPRPQPPRPEKKKITAIDDDFIRTEYFDVDPSVVKSSPPVQRSEGGDSGSSRRKGGKRPSRGGGAGGRGGSSRRGKKSSPRGSGSGQAKEPPDKDKKKKKSGSPSRRRRRPSSRRGDGEK